MRELFGLDRIRYLTVQMERIGPINVDRLRWCSDDFGIAPDDVGEQLNIKPDLWQSVLAGNDGLTFTQLQTLGKLFNRGVLFFVEPGSVTVEQMRTPAFRSIAGDEPELSPEVKTLIERAEAFRATYLALLEEIGELAPPAFAPPRVPTNDAPAAAAIARRWLSLDDNPQVPRDFEFLRQRIEGETILVLRTHDYFGDWRLPKESPVIGFSLPQRVCPVIVVRNQPSKPRTTFTLAHELGHLLLHGRGSLDRVNDLWAPRGREREANAFAGHLLVPDAKLIEIPRDILPADVALFDDALRTWRNAWGVSAEVILRRLVEAGRIPAAKYDAYRNWWKQQQTPPASGGARIYRHREPLHLFGRRYVGNVLTALRSGRITLNKAGKYLDNLKIDQIRELERHLAGV